MGPPVSQVEALGTAGSLRVTVTTPQLQATKGEKLSLITPWVCLGLDITTSSLVTLIFSLVSII